ncbi:helix-turn-helix domain-containing protein [Sphingomonas colocasiae]|uniref:Helix-turn-helix domain-containing protein n=1 Tax=Sphingomonas colocasiae TaxID=1848973 RepID=A0ABS7PYF6_9SPHN|nr:helix-turn-helix domain-containing protein [Sphingomonas colocasiae]
MERDDDNGQSTDEVKRRGRPTLYRAEMAEQARKLCELGATDFELADFFDVDVRTIHRWKHSQPEFAAALRVGKDIADDRVERAYYNRAIGYSYVAEKIFQHQGKVLRADYVEHMPPDSSAAFNWLRNRRPEQWRDRQERHVTGHVAVDPEDPEAARAIIRRHEARMAERGESDT